MERHGIVERNLEDSYLSGDLLDEEDGLLQLQGHSITYRIAVGLQRGRKVFTLQTIPATLRSENPHVLLGKVSGFSLHAGVSASAKNRKKLERLCRYITRPAVSTKRLSLTRGGKVRYELKTAYDDGTTHVVFEPLDFIARLAALVPKPRVNLTRFFGVFAPNSKYRKQIISSRANKVREKKRDVGAACETKRYKMTWAKRLKRIFDIEISVCSHCGGQVKVIACIEEQAVIDKILAHLKEKESAGMKGGLPARGPPSVQLDLLE